MRKIEFLSKEKVFELTLLNVEPAEPKISNDYLSQDQDKSVLVEAYSVRFIKFNNKFIVIYRIESNHSMFTITSLLRSEIVSFTYFEE